MHPSFDVDLKEALFEHASDLPAGADERLRQIDYHPRTTRLGARWRVGALSGATITTGAVISAVVLGGAAPAFAGWSPSPSAASASQTATVDTTCQTQLATQPPWPGVAPTGDWNVVTTDTRGPFSVVIYQNGGDYATCFTGPSFTYVSKNYTSGGTSVSVGGSQSGGGPGARQGGSESLTTLGPGLLGGGADGVEHLSIAHLDAASQGAYTLVEGAVGTGVTGVTLVRSAGENVQATTDNGWFVAWWPGDADVTSLQVATSSGVTTLPISSSVSANAAGSNAAGSGGGSSLNSGP